MQPGDKECHTVPVQGGYVMVKIDFVHENAKNVALPISLPEADIFYFGGCPYHADLMEEKWYSHPAHWSVVN